MGAERKDTDAKVPRPVQGATEPGLGPTSGKATAATEEDSLELVDFDALNAALGGPVLDEAIDYEEMAGGAAVEKGVNEVDDLLVELEPATVKGPGGKPVRGGDSSGQSSATYASARPHTIPPTRAPNEVHAPAVIVAAEEPPVTVPTAPPNMTMPVAKAPAVTQRTPGAPPPPVPGRPPMGSNPVLPQAPLPPPGHPSSGSQPAVPVAAVVPGAPGSAPYIQTPAPFPVPPGVQRPAQHHLTMRMPDWPLLPKPKRQKSATIVVRKRTPSPKQKLLAFMAALLLVTACGIAVIIWRKPALVGIEVPAASSMPGASLLTPSATAPPSAAPPVSATSSATPAPPASSAKPKAKPPASGAPKP